VNSLRISIVQYLNTAPLVRGFAHGPLRGKYDLSFTVPSQCAEALRSGAADLAIIPAIEYQRIPDLALVPNLSIASKKAVRSLLLISRKPVNELTRIALDRGSRSTQALTRILCQKLWRTEPEFFEAEPELPAMLQKADAALLTAISDPQWMMQGVRNRDLVARLYATAPADAQERRRRSARVTRLLRLLRAHGLLEKIPGTHRYQVGAEARIQIQALLACHNANPAQLVANAA